MATLLAADVAHDNRKMNSIISIFRPDFTRPRPMKPIISKPTPNTPACPGKLRRRVCGLLHKALYHISEKHSKYYGLTLNGQILDLPFGLVLKWSDWTSMEEAAAMQMARDAGMPVPRVLSVEEHPNEPRNRFWSILMTRLPGISLENSYDPIDIEPEEPWL